MRKSINAFNVKVFLYGDEFERYKIFEQPVNVPHNNGERGTRGQAKDKEKSIRQAIHRAREKIYGYIMCNQWEYWATQTFNGEVINRYNLDEIVNRYNKKLRNLKARNYLNLKWLVVPEQHKDGAYHLHMLISGIPRDKVVYSGHDYYNKSKNFSRKVYNWLDTIDYGFNDFVYIAECEPLERLKIANYISKYITKDLAEKRFNKKMYWVSRGLSLPTVSNTLTTNINNIIPQDTSIISHNVYYVENPETGQVYGKVYDLLAYNPLPF